MTNYILRAAPRPKRKAALTLLWSTINNSSNTPPPIIRQSQLLLRRREGQSKYLVRMSWMAIMPLFLRASSRGCCQSQFETCNTAHHHHHAHRTNNSSTGDRVLISTHFFRMTIPGWGHGSTVLSILSEYDRESNCGCRSGLERTNGRKLLKLWQQQWKRRSPPNDENSGSISIVVPVYWSNNSFEIFKFKYTQDGY